jgi:hypothetical protein
LLRHFFSPYRYYAPEGAVVTRDGIAHIIDFREFASR